MSFLLDANIVSDLVRHPRTGRVARRIAERGIEHLLCTSIIVAGELRYGARKRASPRLTRQVEAVLGSLEVLPFDVPADAVYGKLRADLERRGQPIGANDLLIAAHALALGHTLVTDNEREFTRIAELPRENWLTTKNEPA
jgi:tRNA(fMet)-specific endonuclease VapC